MNFYRDMSRAQAIEEIKQIPFQPILRPCSYTRNYPSLFAVTYRYEGRILHTLVERLFNGTYVEARWDKKPVHRTATYKSIHDLEAFVKGLGDDDPC